MKPPAGPASARRLRLWRGLALRLTLGLVLASVTLASAATVTIETGGDPDARLELRTVTLPDGTVRDVYVVAAERIVVRTEELRIVASRLEFDPPAGRVRIIGRGRVERTDEVLVGDDLVVDLEDGRLEGRDVWVLTDRVNVFGVQAERTDGRVRLVTGDIAPCDRCGTEVEDYGFLAERVEILPGDRIIAWDAVVLLRERPFLPLPLLVLPIAEPERLPRFAWTRGGSSSQAAIELDWPYVAGPSAYGTLRARLRMDVDPDASAPLSDQLLGGRVESIYPEGGFEHRYFDEGGSGRLLLDVRPPYERDERRRPTVLFEATYRTDEVAGRPQVEARIGRDDARRADLLETDLRLASAPTATPDRPSLRFEVRHRSAIPLAAGAASEPSWDGPSEARAVPLAFGFETVGPPLQAGTLSVPSAGVELGAYEDQPNPVNRFALARDAGAVGRLEARARIALAPTRIGPFEVDGVNDFEGRYYGTAERQVDWLARLRVRLPLAHIGSFAVEASRDAAEGETPFAFDRIRLRTRSELRASLNLTPWIGTSLQAEGGYVLEDDRSPDERGWTPTRVRISAFGRTAWVDLALEHRADPLQGDVGTLRTEASLRVPSSTWTARVSGAVVADLDPTLPLARRDPNVRDAGEASATLALGVRDRLVARADAGYDVEPQPGEPLTWRPLQLTLTGGTLTAGDGIPGAEVFWTIDPNDGATDGAGYRIAVDVGAWRAELDQAYGRAGGERGTHRYALIWTDVARASLEGLELLPSSALGLEPDPAEPRRVTARLRDDGADPATRFNLAYRTDLVPVDDRTERRNSRLEATLRLGERTFGDGWVGLAVDGFGDIALRDDTQPGSYLRRASLTASLDLAARVGLQGTVGYRASYDRASAEVGSGRLSIDRVSLLVRATSELYLGATLDDVWEIVDEDPVSSLAFDPRPTFFLTWDRCCWAFYASWDSRSGEIVLTVGAPGTPEGPQFAFGDGSGPTLPEPRREEETTP